MLVPYHPRMKRLRAAWHAWVASPDWAAAAALMGFSLALVSVVAVALFVTAFVVPHLSTDSAGKVDIALLCLLLIGPFPAYRLRSRISNGVDLEPVQFPPPPSSEWEKLESKHGKEVGRTLLFVLLASLSLYVALTLGFLGLGVSYLFPATKNVSEVASYFTLIGPLVIALIVGIRISPKVTAAAQSHFRQALRALITPAHAKSAELLTLADDLQRQARSAEAIVREVNTLFAELQKDIKEKGLEESALIRRLVEGRRAAEQNQEVVDALFAIWTERGEVGRRKEKRRDRIFDIAMMIVAAVVGYGLAVLYSPDKLGELLNLRT